MRKTSVDIDDRLIDQVRDVLGTSSIKETIDGALREVMRGGGSTSGDRGAVRHGRTRSGGTSR